MTKPNIIFILCDQFRADCLGVDGNTFINTPNLDYLASKGTLFNHAYTACPSCLPARATIMSGQNQWHTGVLGMGAGQGHIPNDFPHTLAGELSNAGYSTKLIGKGHFHPYRASMGFDSVELDESGRTVYEGFEDEYRKYFKKYAPSAITPDDHGVNWNSYHSRPWHTKEYLHPTFWTMSQSINFLKNLEEDESFFLNISFARPHSPYVPPIDYFNMYYDSTLPLPSIGEWASYNENAQDALNVNAWRGKMTHKQIHRAMAGYYGEISFIDTQIGRLINWMNRHKAELLENTWFVFTADHGDMQGDHNLWRKTYAYEGSARIPFFICPPLSFNSEESKRNVADEVIELQDLMPTILSIANVAIPNTVDGENLLPLMYKENSKWREYIQGEHCSCYSPEQEMQYVTNGKRKFIWFPRINEEQFFDLESDPKECINLINDAEHKDEIEKWRNYLRDELDKRDCAWVKDGKLFCPDDEPLVSPHKDSQVLTESKQV